MGGACETYLENIGDLQDFPHDREVGVEKERNGDRDRIGVLGERDGNCIDKNRDQNSSSSACHDHIDKLIRERSIADRFEYFAAYEGPIGQYDNRGGQDFC